MKEYVEFFFAGSPAELQALRVLAVVMVVSGALSFVTLVRGMNAPYGRYSTEMGWGPLIPAKLGWIVQESPMVWWCVAAVLTAKQDLLFLRSTLTPNALLLSLVFIHYFHRCHIRSLFCCCELPAASMLFPPISFICVVRRTHNSPAKFVHKIVTSVTTICALSFSSSSFPLFFFFTPSSSSSPSLLSLFFSSPPSVAPDLLAELSFSPCAHEVASRCRSA